MPSNRIAELRTQSHGPLLIKVFHGARVYNQAVLRSLRDFSTVIVIINLEIHCIGGFFFQVGHPRCVEYKPKYNTIYIYIYIYIYIRNIAINNFIFY
jgi:hypothetical protein